MIYEYVCASCTQVTEKIRKICEADDPCVCEFCGAEALRKHISATSKAIWSCDCPTASGGK